MKKATAKFRSLTPGMDMSKLKNAPVLDNVRKLAPELENLRNASLDKARNLKARLESLKDLSWDLGEMTALIPFWGNPDDTESATPAIPALDSSEEKKNHGKVQEILSSQKSQSSLQESVKELKNATLAVNQSFQKVTEGLAQAQTIAQSSDQISDLSQFSQLWARHHQTYSNLIRDSRLVAGRARVNATNFINNVLPVVDNESICLPERKQKIKDFQSLLKSEMEKSKDLAQGFIDLHENVAAFQEDITNWMKQGEKIRNDALTLAEDIKKTKEGIQRLSRKAFMNAASSLGLGTLAAGAVAIGILCPMLWIGAAFAGVKAIKEGKMALDRLRQKKGDEDEIQRKSRQLDDKLKALDTFKRIQVILEPALTDLCLVQDKLNVFAHMWTFIRADATAIEKALDLSTNSATKMLFKARVKTASATYTLLNKALEEYETGM